MSCQLRNTIVKQRWESWRKTTKKKPKRQDDGFQNIFQTDKGATAANIYIQKRSNQEELDIYNPRPQSSTHTWLRVFYLFDCFVNLSLCSSKAITVSVSRWILFFFYFLNFLFPCCNSCLSSKWKIKSRGNERKSCNEFECRPHVVGWLEIVITAFARVNTTPTIFGSTRICRKIVFFVFFLSREREISKEW